MKTYVCDNKEVVKLNIQHNMEDIMKTLIYFWDSFLNFIFSCVSCEIPYTDRNIETIYDITDRTFQQ